MPLSAQQYTLRRLNWRKADTGSYYTPRAIGWFRLPGTTRLATFPDAESAERERRRLEEEARQAVNPFLCGTSMADRSSLDEGRLCDWLLDLGIDPPAMSKKAKGRNWAEWWEEEHELWDDHQLARVWEALDRLRFHEVVHGPVRPVVYVVVEIPWHYTDEDYYASEEGGPPRRVFRTRAEARAFCKDKYADFSDEPFDMTTRVKTREDPLGLSEEDEESGDSDSDVPMYDILEVEVLD